MKSVIVMSAIWAVLVGLNLTADYYGLPCLASLGPPVRELWSSLGGFCVGFTLPFFIPRWCEKSPERCCKYDLPSLVLLVPFVLYSLDIFYAGLAYQIGSSFALAFILRRRDATSLEERSGREARDGCSPLRTTGLEQTGAVNIGIIALIFSSFIRPTLTSVAAIAGFTILITSVVLGAGIYALVQKRRDRNHGIEAYVILGCAPLVLARGLARLL